MSTIHSERAHEILKQRDKVDHHDATFWQLRQGRDKMAKGLPEWESLRDHASAIKRHTLTHLADYLEQFSSQLESRGVIVHWAKDATELNEMVYGILESHKVTKMVKSKSMLTEECGLNAYLEQRGIDVVETDLGERILQLMHRAPHISWYRLCISPRKRWHRPLRLKAFPMTKEIPTRPI
jgi:L-lactate dehydrogenase complex protein LldF